MDILRNLFFAYVATVVAFTTPLLPTSLRAKVKAPMTNDLKNVSATASGSAEMGITGGIVDLPTVVMSPSVTPKPDVVIDDGAFIGKLPSVVVSITPTPTPCVDMFPQQVANSNQLVPCANPAPSTPTSTPTPPPGCYYEQMNCIQGGPVGSSPASCLAKLICKATGAPVPSEVPPGCYAMQICDEFPIGDVQPMWAPNGLVQGQSGPFVGPKCRTEVICGKGTPTTVPSKTPTPLPSATMPTATLTPTPMAVCDYAAPPAGCAYIKGPKFNTVTQCGMELKCTGALVPTSTPTPPPGCYYEQMNCIQGGPVGSASTNCPAKLICKAQPLPITSPLPVVTSTPTSTLTPTPPPGCKYVTEPGVCAQLIDPRTGVAAPCPQLTHLVCVPTIIPTKPACQPRPACLDATNGGIRCLLLEPKEGWCPQVAKPTITILPSPVVTKVPVATPTPPPGCYYEQMNCIQGGPVGSIPTLCPAKLVCPPTKTPLPTAKPTATLTPTITPTPVVLCSYASPPPGCVYVKGPKFNAVTQCGMELKCTGALTPTSKPSVSADDYARLQRRLEELNKQVASQKAELAKTNSLLERLQTYLRSFLNWR